MKKKNKGSKETPNRDEIFPVDALGIPILVDVVPSTTAADSDQGPKNRSINCDNISEPAPPELIPDSDQSAELPRGSDLDQIFEKITESVTDRIIAAIKPLVRHEIDRALRAYDREQLRLPREKSKKKPKPD